MKVTDALEKNPITVTPQTTLRQIARLIFGAQMSGLPVVDDKGKLVGVVVEKDILSQFYPSQTEYIEDFTSTYDFEAMEERATEKMNLPVEKFMTKNPVTILPQTPLLKAGSLMMSRRFRRLPVVDSRGHLLGMVSLGSIFRAIVKERLPVGKKGLGFFTHLARVFDLSYSWEEREKYEIPFLVKNLKKRGAETVIDVGCGTGGHVTALAKLGFKVTGADTSKEMINEARKKLAGLPQKVQKNIDFANIPLKKFNTLKGKKFDAAIFMGNALSNFLDIEKDIRALNEILNPKATLIFHLRNFEKLMETRQRFVSLNFSPGFDEKEKEFAFLRFYGYPDHDTVILNIETLVYDGRRWRSYGVESTVQRPFTRTDIKNLVESIGFKKIDFYGNFGGESYRASNEFMIAVATR
ncbi:CBS domain-containing protein [Candidatus Microgenomates bacterium]|nr:CBS domain-containing protein [Candidatus Microgenomates bacterium]